MKDDEGALTDFMVGVCILLQLAALLAASAALVVILALALGWWLLPITIAAGIALHRPISRLGRWGQPLARSKRERE